MSEQRLIDLETKYSFQENLLEELRKTVHEQYLTIEKLEKNLKFLTSRLESLLEDDIDSSHKKPPHY